MSLTGGFFSWYGGDRKVFMIKKVSISLKERILGTSAYSFGFLSGFSKSIPGIGEH